MKAMLRAPKTKKRKLPESTHHEEGAPLPPQKKTRTSPNIVAFEPSQYPVPVHQCNRCEHGTRLEPRLGEGAQVRPPPILGTAITKDGKTSSGAICRCCDLILAHASDYARHYDHVHTPAGVWYLCAICPLHLDREQYNLTKHILDKHSHQLQLCCTPCNTSFNTIEDFHAHHHLIHEVPLPEVAITTTPGKSAFDGNPRKVAIEAQYFDSFVKGCDKYVQALLKNQKPPLHARKAFSKSGLPFFAVELGYWDFRLNSEICATMLKWQSKYKSKHPHCVEELEAIARGAKPAPTPAPTPLSSCPSAFTSQDLFKLNACNAIASSSHISIYIPPPPPPPLPSMSYYQSYPSTPPLTDSSTPFSSPSLSPCPTPPLISPSSQEAKPAVPIGCRYSSELSVKPHRQLSQFAFRAASFSLKPATFPASNARGMDVSESSRE